MPTITKYVRFQKGSTTAYGILEEETIQEISGDLLGARQRAAAKHKLSDVKLLQGDLAESWREGDKEYATVAMRYSLRDRYVDRATGRAADGNDQPQEVTEVWTFTRAPGGSWLVSAVQQTQ